MRSLPFLQVKTTTTVQWHGVTVEQVRHEDEVAIGCELIGYQLSVLKSVADHIGESRWLETVLDFATQGRFIIILYTGDETYNNTAFSVDLSAGYEV